jgi:hypothetical protein
MNSWSQLGASAKSAEPKIGSSEGFEFIPDPFALLDRPERESLAADLAHLDKGRRDAEAESLTLRLA